MIILNIGVTVSLPYHDRLFWNESNLNQPVFNNKTVLDFVQNNALFLKYTPF